MTYARGTFEVKLNPLAMDERPEEYPMSRFSIDKQFYGDLEASSKGQMLSAGTETPGSAGYVAIERVTGTLHGRRGTFLLQHNGILDRGAGKLSILVIPDSGTGELAGLSGKMEVIIEGETHLYEFEYTISPDLPVNGD